MSDLHGLGDWTFHKMSVTKFGSVFFENVWQGVNLPPPNQNRIDIEDYLYICGSEVPKYLTSCLTHSKQLVADLAYLW